MRFPNFSNPSALRLIELKGNPPSVPKLEREQEQGRYAFWYRAVCAVVSLDLPLTGGDAGAGSKRRRTPRLGGNANGHMRGKVGEWERESVGSRSPSPMGKFR